MYYGKPNIRAFSEAVGFFLWEKQGSRTPPKAALWAAGRLWRDLIIARPGEENAPTVAGASGRASLRAAGAAKLLLRTKTQTTLSLNKL